MNNLFDSELQDRLVQYASIDTTSDEESSSSPSTNKQFDLLNLLVEKRQVVKASSEVVFAAAAYDEMVAKITARIKDQGQITLAEVRDMFQTSRKYAQALLEHLDGEKITRRVGDARVLY